MDKSIQGLENLRKRAATLLGIIASLSITVAVICVILFTSAGMDEIGLYAAIAVGVGFGYLLGLVTGFFDLSKKYKARFKTTFVETPLRKTFTEVYYDGDQGIDEGVIEKTGIMSMGNRYYSNDYVRGYYKDVKFERSDVKIQQHTSTGKSSYTVTYLHGRWLIFEFNKNFNSDLQIISHGFPNPKKKNSFFTETEDRRHRIKLEDIEFNDNFDVLCQDEHEAYYILTPQFMSIIKNMKSTMDGAFMLGFIDNQLHIAIHNEKDAMEPKLFENINLNLIKEEVQAEIKLIISIIDNMDLDRDIYNN